MAFSTDPANETVEPEGKRYLKIVMTFRGRNTFNALVLQCVFSCQITKFLWSDPLRYRHRSRPRMRRLSQHLRICYYHQRGIPFDKTIRLRHSSVPEAIDHGDGKMKGTRPLTNEIRRFCMFHRTYDVRNRGLFMLGVSTGGRISELLSLTIGDVYQNRKAVTDLLFDKSIVKG